MANIHVLSDVRQASTRTSGDLFINESNPPPRPRCIDLFFPHFRWNSFIVIISIVQIATYIVALSLGSFALTPSMTSLSSMGASYGPAIAAGQVWRLITPLFLHGSIWHILVSYFWMKVDGNQLVQRFLSNAHGTITRSRLWPATCGHSIFPMWVVWKFIFRRLGPMQNRSWRLDGRIRVDRDAAS